MSQARLHPSYEPSFKKKFKLFHFPDKPCEILAFVARFSLLLCLISSVFLVIYTTFDRRNRPDWIHFPTIPNRTSRLQRPTGPTNISHVIFGIGGSAATWHDRSRYSSLWWKPGLTHGFVWLDEEPENKTIGQSPVPPHRVSSPEWTKFKFSSSQAAVRIARIISDSFRMATPETRWFVMGDDDTAFFTENLVAVLGKYDHNRMWYIGGNSESVEQDVFHSYDMAFGGGGFAISFPLAEQLVKILDGCLDRYYYFYGSDQRIWACICEIGVGLTKERGFHQFDIRGNPYGILAAHPQTPLVSLHHLDYLDSLFPYRNQMDSLKSIYESYELDPPRIMQQTFCHEYNRKWSVSIAWGFTIQLYTSLLPASYLQTPLRTFKTWRSGKEEPFIFNTRPIPTDPCAKPVVFMLEKVQAVRERGTVTSYKRFDPPKTSTICNTTEHVKAMSVDRIFVSSMKLDRDYWTKAPRRQCCQFLNAGDPKNSFKIRIRNCRPYETVTV